MQYLLTQQEYDKLVPKAELDSARKALALAREAILRSAKFTCIHEGKRGYCDFCPIGDLAGKIAYNDSKLICTLHREYSK